MGIKPGQVHLNHFTRHAKVNQPVTLGFECQVTCSRRIKVQDTKPGTREYLSAPETRSLGKVERKRHYGWRRAHWPAPL
jgi:hypothetical protein